MPVKITEETIYPFEETIRLKMEMPESVKFPLYLRIPSWCENAEVKVNGRNAGVKAKRGKYVRLSGKWNNGDEVTLHFPMKIETVSWPTNKESVSVNYGPLTFSLLIKEDYKKVKSNENAIWDSKWQKDADVDAWPTYEIYPGSPWNYALCASSDDLRQMVVEKREWPSDDFPFSANSVPIIIKAKGCRVPSWKIDKYGLCGVLPDENCKQSDSIEDITLVPMGAARLRISAFPVAHQK